MSEQVAQMERQAETLESDAATGQTLAHPLAELRASLEELRVAGEPMGQQQDAPARIHAETEAERQRYARLFDLAPEGYLVTNPDGVILEANRAALLFLHAQPGYLMGKHALNYVALDDRRQVRRPLLALSQKNNASSPRLEAHISITPFHAAPFDAVLRLTGVYDGQTGALASVYWALQDMSARNRDEAERYRLLVEATEDYAVFIMDESGEILHWNRGAAQMFGYDKAEAVGMNAARLYPQGESGGNRLQSELETARRLGRKDEAGWYVRRNGGRLYAEGALVALRFRGHQGFGKVLRDRTRQRQAEAERIAAYQTAEEALTSVADGFYTVDSEWRITHVNGRAERMWGKTGDELRNAPLWDVFTGGKDTLAHLEHERACREQKPVDFETYLPERRIWIEVNIYPSASGLSAHFGDITARKDAEQALRAPRDA